uniref:Uncharacterized protein n=1 Tax=Emiliania huxleyi TaxID=2903 RepID=A0A6V2WV14_EMIHU
MGMCDGAKYLSESPFWGEQYASAFRRIRYAAIMSDLVRIAYLAEHGGFYVDSDHTPGNLSLIELVRTVQDAKKNLVLPLVPEKELVKGEQVRVYNALLGAVPRHPGMIHQSCPEGWTEKHFDASDPITERFGNAFGFAQLLAVLGESTESWNLGQMTWCRLLKMKSDDQGVRAEALWNILALDGVRTMLPGGQAEATAAYARPRQPVPRGVQCCPFIAQHLRSGCLGTPRQRSVCRSPPEGA